RRRTLRRHAGIAPRRGGRRRGWGVGRTSRPRRFGDWQGERLERLVKERPTGREARGETSREAPQETGAHGQETLLAYTTGRGPNAKSRGGGRKPAPYGAAAGG